MFSPILPIKPLRTSSKVGPKPSWAWGKAPKASMSAGWCLAINSAAACAKAKKLSFLVTKSVSQLTSNKAPVLPCMAVATTPSAVTRAAALLALLPNLTRNSSSALTKSPSASVKAFLHSIMGASVLARNSATMLAVIAAINTPRFQFNVCCSRGGAKKGPREPLVLIARGPSSLCIHLDEFVLAFSHSFDNVVHGVGAAFQNGVRDATGIQRDRLR